MRRLLVLVLLALIAVPAAAQDGGVSPPPATPTPAPTGPAPDPSATPEPQPAAFTAVTGKRVFCVRPSCDPRGVRIRVDVAGVPGDLELAGPLKRGLRTVGQVEHLAPPGRSTLKLLRVRGKVLRRGRYSLTLYAIGGVPPQTVAFKIR